MLKNAFGDYVASFNLSNILYQRNTNKPITSRELYWLIDHQFTRLAIAQETPDPKEGLKASGKMIKMMASGGDTIVARRNFDRVDTKFNIETTWMIMGNDSLDVDIKDTMEHCIEFSSVCQFKTQAEIDAMKANDEPKEVWSVYHVKDESLKRRLRTEEYMNAFVYLLYQSYTNEAVENPREIVDEESVILRSLLFVTFEFTGNKEDYILASKVFDLIEDCKKKIRLELVSIPGVDYKKSKLRVDGIRDKYCFFGLKLKVVDEVEAC